MTHDDLMPAGSVNSESLHSLICNQIIHLQSDANILHTRCKYINTVTKTRFCTTEIKLTDHLSTDVEPNE